MSITINQGDINCNHYCRDIDNEMLIQEVKARPALYNRTIREYNDQAFKKAMWEEISAKIYHDIWDEMNESQKEAKGAEILKRWNNLRTCFSRELKIMRDPLQNKRKKYIYFDKLLFLLDEIRPDLITVKETEPFVFSNSSFEQEDDPEQSSILKKTLENKPKRKQKSKNRDLEKYVQSSINKLREEFVLKERRDDSVDYNLPKTFDTSADTNFALSLVPTLKMIPIDNKIDAQIEILNVLKKYLSKTTYDYNIVKYEREEQSEADDSSEILSLFGEEN